MFVLRRGASPDPEADILTEPYAFTYQWDRIGSAVSPMTFKSEATASMFGRTMLAGPFHVATA